MRIFSIFENVQEFLNLPYRKECPVERICLK